MPEVDFLPAWYRRKRALNVRLLAAGCVAAFIGLIVCVAMALS